MCKRRCAKRQVLTLENILTRTVDDDGDGDAMRCDAMVVRDVSSKFFT